MLGNHSVLVCMDTPMAYLFGKGTALLGNGSVLVCVDTPMPYLFDKGTALLGTIRHGLVGSDSSSALR